MLKQEIINQLHDIHTEVNQYISHQDSNALNQSRENGKWSNAEEIGHLINALEQTNKGLGLPKFFLKYKFGTCNRPERTYVEVVKKYNDKLSQVAVPNNPFQIKNVSVISKEKLLEKYQIQQAKFQKRLQSFSEKQLSTLVIPHPLLGKLTLREFAYFTHHHTQHHFENIKK